MVLVKGLFGLVNIDIWWRTFWWIIKVGCELGKLESVMSWMCFLKLFLKVLSGD